MRSIPGRASFPAEFDGRRVRGALPVKSFSERLCSSTWPGTCGNGPATTTRLQRTGPTPQACAPPDPHAGTPPRPAWWPGQPRRQHPPATGDQGRLADLCASTAYARLAARQGEAIDTSTAQRFGFRCTTRPALPGGDHLEHGSAIFPRIPSPQAEKPAAFQPRNISTGRRLPMMPMEVARRSRRCGRRRRALVGAAEMGLVAGRGEVELAAASA